MPAAWRSRNTPPPARFCGAISPARASTSASLWSIAARPPAASPTRPAATRNTISPPVLLRLPCRTGKPVPTFPGKAGQQGNVLAVTGNTGAIEQHFFYTPFGVELEGDPSGNPFRYTGRRYDAETGLYYYRARYYDADLGRFLQVDPVGYADQWNLYAYVGNNPLNATDPTGMYVCADSGGAEVSCSQEITQAAEDIHAASESEDSSEAARESLAAISSLLGAEGEENGVVLVAGGNTGGSDATADVASDGTVTIQIGAHLDNPAGTMLGRIMYAATVAHEAQHGLQGRAAGNRNPLNRSEEFNGEVAAYRAGDYMRLWYYNSGQAMPSTGYYPLEGGLFQVNEASLAGRAERSTSSWCRIAVVYMGNTGC
jgi:RHS repeat-associated protein